MRESWIVVRLTSSDDALVVLWLQPSLQVRKGLDGCVLLALEQRRLVIVVIARLIKPDSRLFDNSLIVLPENNTIDTLAVVNSLHTVSPQM